MKRSDIIIAVVFVIAAFIIYSNVLNGEFLYDDYDYIVENSAVHNFSNFSLSDPRQVGYFSFALNYALGKNDPFGYHVVNIAIHAANAVLLFLLVNAILAIFTGGAAPGERHLKIPLLAAALFLVHPVETQAVSYITQRFTSLAAFFYLSAVYLYLKARQRLEKERRGAACYIQYAASFLATVLAMRTKEISFTIPFMILAEEAFLFKDSVFGRRRFYLLLPFAASLVIIPLAIIGPEMGLLPQAEGLMEMTRGDKIRDLQTLSPYEYLLTQFRVLVIYLRLLLLPVNQSAIYDLTASRTFLDISVVSSLAILLCVMAAGFFVWMRSSRLSREQAARRRLFSIGIFWFFLASSVESSFIPIKDLIFEHRAYLPSAGAFMTIAVLLTAVADRLIKRGNEFLRTAAVLLVCLPLGAATYVRNDVWSSEMKFWDDIVHKMPNKPIGYNNRSHAYAKAGRFDLALMDTNKTISYFLSGFTENLTWEKADLNPGNMSKTYLQRSFIYSKLGNIDLAVADDKRAKDIWSFFPVLIDVSRRANSHYRNGEFKDAIAEYSRLLDWDPENAGIRNARGNAYLKSGRYDDAINDFSMALTINPNYAEAYYNRSMALNRSGNKEMAGTDLARACSMGFQTACDNMQK